MASGQIVSSTATATEGPFLITGGASTTITSTVIWTRWNNEYILTAGDLSTGATSATTTNNAIWTLWVQDSGTGGSATTITATATPSQATIWGNWSQNFRTTQVTQDQLREQQRCQEEYQRRQIEAEAERAAARDRAALLLQESLSERQRLELADKGHFSLTVIDSKTKEERIYRIRKGRHGNVDRLDISGRVLNRFCIHPRISCPDEDTMLAQKLMLEHDEEAFLKIANRS